MIKYILFLVSLMFLPSCSSYNELVLKGDKKMKEGLTNRSQAYFKKALKKDPDRAEAYLKLGEYYANIGNIEKAINHFNMAIEISQVPFLICDYVKQRNEILLESVYKTISEPYNPENFENYLLSVYALNEINKSSLMYDCSLELNTNKENDRLLSFYMAKSLYEKEEYSEAIRFIYLSDVETSIDQLGKEYTTLLIDILIKQKDFRRALLYTHELSDYNSRKSNDNSFKETVNSIYNRLAQSLINEGRYRDARILISSKDDYIVINSELTVQINKKMFDILLKELQNVNDRNDVSNKISELESVATLFALDKSRNTTFTNLAAAKHYSLKNFSKVIHYYELYADKYEQNLQTSYQVYLESLYQISLKAYKANRLEKSGFYLNKFLDNTSDSNNVKELKNKVIKLLGKTYLGLGVLELSNRKYTMAFNYLNMAQNVSEDVAQEVRFARHKIYKQTFMFDQALEEIITYLTNAKIDSEEGKGLYGAASILAIQGKTEQALSFLEKLRSNENRGIYIKMARSDNDFFNLKNEPNFSRWLNDRERYHIQFTEVLDLEDLDYGWGTTSDLYFVIEYNGKCYESVVYSDISSAVINDLYIIDDLPEVISIFAYDYDGQARFLRDQDETALVGTYNTITKRFNITTQKFGFRYIFRKTNDPIRLSNFSMTCNRKIQNSKFEYTESKGCAQIAFETLYSGVKSQVKLVPLLWIELVESLVTSKDIINSNSAAGVALKGYTSSISDKSIVNTIKKSNLLSIGLKGLIRLGDQGCL